MRSDRIRRLQVTSWAAVQAAASMMIKAKMQFLTAACT